VIHCGWNSTLEAIMAGVPMVTWPVSAEQFYNEKLVTGTLNIGVRVGVQVGAALVGDRVKKDAIEKAIMEDKDAEELRTEQGSWEKWQRELLKKVGLLILISTLSMKN